MRRFILDEAIINFQYNPSSWKNQLSNRHNKWGTQQLKPDYFAAVTQWHRVDWRIGRFAYVDLNLFPIDTYNQS